MIGGSNKTVVTSFWLVNAVAESENLLQALWLGFVKYAIWSHFGFCAMFSEDCLRKKYQSQTVYVKKKNMSILSWSKVFYLLSVKAI